MTHDTRIAPRRDELITSDNRMTRRFAEFLEEQTDTVNTLDEKSGVQDSLIALSNRQRGKITALEQEVADLKEMIFELSARKKPVEQESESDDERFALNRLHNKITALTNRLDDIEAEAIHIPKSKASDPFEPEEGVWTPVLTDGSNDATSTTAVGTYTKVGRKVHVKGYLLISSLGSVSGALLISGLPFTSSATANTFSAANFGRASNMAITQFSSISGWISSNDTTIRCVLWDATTGTSNLQHSEWTAAGSAIFDATYYV